MQTGSPVRVWAVTPNRSSWGNSTIAELTSMSGAPNIGQETGWAYDSVNHLIGGGVQNGHIFMFDPTGNSGNGSWVDRTMVPSAGSIGTLAFHALDFDGLNGVYLFITDLASGRHTWAYRY